MNEQVTIHVKISKELAEKIHCVITEFMADQVFNEKLQPGSLPLIATISLTNEIISSIIAFDKAIKSFPFPIKSIPFARNAIKQVLMNFTSTCLTILNEGPDENNITKG